MPFKLFLLDSFSKPKSPSIDKGTKFTEKLSLLFHFIATPAKKVQANPVTCEVCEYAMNYLDSILADNATEKEIIDALDSLCAKLPSSISGEVNLQFFLIPTVYCSKYISDCIIIYNLQLCVSIQEF